MKLSTMLLAMLLLASIAGCRQSSPEVPPLDGLQGLPDLTDLNAALQVMLEVHEDCELTSEAKSRFPQGVDGRGGWSGFHDQCLGRLRVVSLTKEAPDLAAVKVRRRSSPKLYIVFAAFVEGEWVLSWPTELAPGPINSMVDRRLERVHLAASCSAPSRTFGSLSRQ